jgi:AcrR family transcriptional regulator
MAGLAHKPIDPSTEEKIKEAARIIFTQKGFAATRTRDIAEAAGLNLALLNYYFRSKEKLFDIIMMESLLSFIKGIREIVSNEQSSLDDKVSVIVNNYIDMLIQQPDLPLFILSEVRANPKKLVIKTGIREVFFQSHFMKQLQEAISSGALMPVHPMQFLMNVVGMSVFPFIASPLLRNVGDLTAEEFNELMQERKKLIPHWIRLMYRPA